MVVMNAVFKVSKLDYELASAVTSDTGGGNRRIELHPHFIC